MRRPDINHYPAAVMKQSKIHSMRMIATFVLGAFLSVAVAQSRMGLPQPTKHVAASFPSVSVEAKSVFISTYANPTDNSGLTYPEPPAEFATVKKAIELWPMMTRQEREAIAQLKKQIRQWNRYEVVSDAEKADLVMIVRFGRDVTDKKCEPSEFDCPHWLRIDDALYLYSSKASPGLLWRGIQTGGLHLHDGQFALLNELERDVHDVASMGQ